MYGSQYEQMVAAAEQQLRLTALLFNFCHHKTVI